jgi:hypothetical protein
MGTLSKATLIDDMGRAWDAQCPSLRAKFGLAHDVGDVTIALIQMAGCIRIDAGKRAVHIAFNPKTVSPVAIGGLLYFVHDQHLHTHPNLVFCLSLLDDVATTARVVEVYTSIKHAANRLQFLSEEHRLNRQKRFVSKLVPLSSAEQIPGFSHVLEVWRASNASYDQNTIRPILNSHLGNRYCLIGPSQRGSGFTFLEMGTGYRIPLPDYAKRANGLELNAIPDARYADWLSATYALVMKMGRPRFEDIAVHIFFADTGLVQRRYKRLLLPWLGEAGERLLLSTSSG